MSEPKNRVLKVNDDSMSAHGILAGDFVVVADADSALPGEWIVGEDGGASGMRQYKDGMTVRARVIGLMRRYS